MLLACDAGNSSTSFGLFDDNENITATFRINTGKLSSVNKLKKFLSENVRLKEIDKVSIASVVPWLNPMFSQLFEKAGISPFFISSSVKLNIKICIENHEKIGADRIANICYAYAINKKFQTVIDMGTALTIDVVDGKGDFLGGIIYPGIPLLSDCLYKSTEKLPLVEVSETKSISIIGINTESAIKSGIYNGNLFIIKGFIAGIADYYSRNSNNMDVVFTGGNSGMFYENIDINEKKSLDPDLTIKGVKYIYDLNRTADK